MTVRRDFNQEAGRWDDNPRRVVLATAVVEAIRRHVDLDETMHVLDFGCGTGLISLGLSPLVGSVTGVDSSAGMIEVLREKIAAARLSNVAARLIDFEHREAMGGPYDLVCSSMTLHHVPDIFPLLERLHGLLRPGGVIAVADLDPDGGHFHGDNTGVFHSGFVREDLAGHFRRAGFKNVGCVTAHAFEKADAQGVTRAFSVFLMTARK